MPDVLAVCDSCGSFFRAYGVEVYDGPEVEVIEATVSVGSDVHTPPCPKCGGTGHLLSGVYNVVGDTLELLQGPERTVSELERLAELLRSARERGADVEEVKQEVQRRFPELGPSLVKLLVPRSPADLAAYLMLIVMVIGMVVEAKRDDRPVNVTVEQVINNYVTVQTPSPSTQPGVASHLTMNRKVGRNEPCPCGSGKKYKKCHGDPTREQQQPPPR